MWCCKALIQRWYTSTDGSTSESGTSLPSRRATKYVREWCYIHRGQVRRGPEKVDPEFPCCRSATRLSTRLFFLARPVRERFVTLRIELGWRRVGPSRRDVPFCVRRHCSAGGRLFTRSRPIFLAVGISTKRLRPGDLPAGAVACIGEISPCEAF
jgi:hypothetical protein